jgi:hypothetical protein
MNNKQESKYSMELALYDFLNQNANITATIPNFEILFPEFKANINQIQIIREQQEADRTGIAVKKEHLRNDLIDLAIDVSRKTEAYSKMTNNSILEKEVHYSESDLKRYADTILEDCALLIHNKANSNLADLKTYGVTENLLAELKSAIELFHDAIPKPRLGITKKKQATDQLELLFKANDAILEKFDILIEIVRKSEPVFYAAYRDNRKIIETGTVSLAVKGMVTDKESGKPVKGAMITFSLKGESEQSSNVKPYLVKKTAGKGRFKIRNLHSGIYNVTIKKNGFADEITTIAVSDRETSELNIQLRRNIA